MKEVLDFLMNQWMYVTAIVAVLYLLVSQPDDAEVDALSPQDLTLLLNKGNITVFDLRGTDAFTKGHVKGARLFSKDASMTEIAKLFKHNRDMVFVCQDGRMSSKIAARVQSKSRMKVTSLHGGMAAWQEARFPVEVEAEQVK